MSEIAKTRHIEVCITGRDAEIALAALSKQFIVNLLETPEEVYTVEDFKKEMRGLEIASLISSSRWKRQMSQKDLSKAVGISQSSISEYETGRKKPSEKTFRKICHVLNVSKSNMERRLKYIA